VGSASQSHGLRLRQGLVEIRACGFNLAQNKIAGAIQDAADFEKFVAANPSCNPEITGTPPSTDAP